MPTGIALEFLILATGAIAMEQRDLRSYKLAITSISSMALIVP